MYKDFLHQNENNIRLLSCLLPLYLRLSRKFLFSVPTIASEKIQHSLKKLTQTCPLQHQPTRLPLLVSNYTDVLECCLNTQILHSLIHRHRQLKYISLPSTIGFLQFRRQGHLKHRMPSQTSFHSNIHFLDLQL